MGLRGIGSAALLRWDCFFYGMDMWKIWWLACLFACLPASYKGDHTKRLVDSTQSPKYTGTPYTTGAAPFRYRR